MKIYSVLQRGEYHLNNCDDQLFIDEIGNDKILCAVMDGCTMAKDSYFASTLVSRVLRKIARSIGYKEFYSKDPLPEDIDTYLKTILKELFKELNLAKNLLMLEQKELLTTIIILLYDRIKDQGIVLAVGDGLVSINGVITEFDQDNKPDYLGFHLSEDPDTWYAGQSQKILFNKLSNISIATDGITLFEKIALTKETSPIDPIEFLLTDKTGAGDEDMLYLKLKRLEHTHGLKPTDDLALIRIIV